MGVNLMDIVHFLLLDMGRKSELKRLLKSRTARTRIQRELWDVGILELSQVLLS